MIADPAKAPSDVLVVRLYFERKPLEVVVPATDDSLDVSQTCIAGPKRVHLLGHRLKVLAGPEQDQSLLCEVVQVD